MATIAIRLQEVNQEARRRGVAHQWSKHGRHSLVTWLMAV
jgi:hypothetical protein